MAVGKRRAHPRITPRVPREVARAAAALKAQFSGVAGVFWGRGKTARRRHRKPHLCVHVYWKRDVTDAELIPNPFMGFPTDVIEVGRPQAHALGSTCDLVGSGLVRHGTIAAVADDGAGSAIALMSGHVVLATAHGSILTDYVGTPTGGTPLHAIDDDGALFRGRVLRGRLANHRDIDFAIARFGGVAGMALNPVHRLLGAPPFGTRSVALIDGEPLHHDAIAQGRRGRMTGSFDQQAATELELRLPDGTSGDYVDVIAVSSLAGEPPFSIEGDSGSLVFDDARTVVGMVLGSTAHHDIAYVLPIGPVVDTLDDVRSLFFL